MKHDNLFDHCIGFQWDKGNELKNWHSHNVSTIEAEQAFFNIPFFVQNDNKHSVLEQRYFILGQTNLSRKLFIVFTIRHNLIRIISARDMNKKERALYEKMQESTKI